MVSLGRRGVGTCLAGALLAGAVGSATPVAAAPDCRVRNVTQDAYGHSLIRMVQLADDGDRLWVKNTCPGEVVIRADIVIRGVGERPTLTGQRQRRVVRIAGGASVVLRGLTIEHGDTRAWGGGVFNAGRTTIRESIVRANTSSSGGGVANAQGDIELTIVDSRVRGNRSRFDGGGVYNDIGSIRIIRTTVAGNHAVWGGGGISQSSDEGSITVTDSSVVGNRSNRDGGGLANYGVLSLTRSVVRDNVAGRRGGGIMSGGGDMSGPVALVDTIVRENTAGESGGGIWNRAPTATVTLEGTSLVSLNIPDDCVGTPAC